MYYRGICSYILLISVSNIIAGDFYSILQHSLLKIQGRGGGGGWHDVTARQISPNREMGLGPPLSLSLSADRGGDGGGGGED